MRPKRKRLPRYQVKITKAELGNGDFDRLVNMAYTRIWQYTGKPVARGDVCTILYVDGTAEYEANVTLTAGGRNGWMTPVKKKK